MYYSRAPPDKMFDDFEFGSDIKLKVKSFKS